MRHRVVFVVGAAVGYVLGTRAGRERYEQIKNASRKVAGSPAVRGAAGAVRERASDAGKRVVRKARERGGARASGGGHGPHGSHGAHGSHGEKAGSQKGRARRGHGRRSRRPRRHATVTPDPGTPGMEAGRENADF